MCGINLILDKTCLLGEDIIGRMNASTAHRGPDAVQTRVIREKDFQVFLGVNRLQVIDLHQRADQPFSDEHQDQLLAYNGEIYNAFEIRNQLIDDAFQFYTRSDTEVLLHAIGKYDEACLPLLEGMFAFVHYDRPRKKLLLARDRHGMKPLYYYEDDQYFIASSEIKGLLATGLIKKELDEQQVQHYLRFKFAQKPATFFKNIFELAEGSYIAMTPDSPWEVRGYLPEPLPAFPQADENATSVIDTTERLLTDALLKHVVADVPMGLFLSGGVDSTLLLALLQKEGISPLSCFSIVNLEKDAAFGTDDYRFASKAAQQYGAYHDQLEVSATDLGEFNSFIASTNQPIGDSGAFMTHLLSMHTAKKVKVVLSGAGADEIFAGYNRHLAFAKYLKHKKLLTTFLPLIKVMAPLLPTGGPNPWRKKAQLYDKLIANISEDPLQTFKNFGSLRTLSGDEEVYSKVPKQDSSHLMQQALYFDRTNYLISDVLALSDGYTMRHSLEMRMPYLDNDLVAYADALGPTAKLKKGSKWILRHILQRNGGKLYTSRKKEGFGLPFGKWVQEGKAGEIIKIFDDENIILYNFVLKSRVDQMLKEHLQQKKDFTLELWSLVVLAHWLQKEFSTQ